MTLIDVPGAGTLLVSHGARLLPGQRGATVEDLNAAGYEARRPPSSLRPVFKIRACRLQPEGGGELIWAALVDPDVVMATGGDSSAIAVNEAKRRVLAHLVELYMVPDEVRFEITIDAEVVRVDEDDE